MNRVAVVILNYNGISHLQTFLPSVVSNSAGAHIYVVDNGSTDGSVSFLRENFPTVHRVELEKNLGFCEGYNVGLQGIESEYFVLLNSDVEVTENWLGPCITLMDSNKNIGACQPKILSANDKNQFEYAGAAGGFIDRYGYPFCRGRIFQTLEKDEGQYDDPSAVFWASGACFFVRSKLFHHLGGFDPTFYAHMEEIDLCWRIQKAGYSVYCNPASKVFHLGGGTLSQENTFKTYLNFRNSLLTILKNYSNARLWVILPVRMLLDSMAFFLFLFRRGIGHSMAIIRAYYYALWKADIKKTSGQQAKFILPKSIAMAYYFKGIRKFSALSQN